MPKLGEVTPFVGDKKVLAAYVGDTLVQYAGGLGGTVLLNARDNTIHPDVTFDRANAGMVCDEQGNWTWTDKPYRLSYDVQTKEWGYLFEPQRTNAFDGLSWNAIPTTENTTLFGFPARRTTIDNENRFQKNFDLSPGQSVSGSVTGSVFVKNDSSVSVWFSLFEHNGVVPLGPAIEIPPGVAKRCVISGNSTSGTTLYMISGGMNSAIPLPAGITIACPQLETGPIATSPIATNGAQKTVAADVCTYVNSVLIGVEGTVLARFNAADPGAANNSYIFQNWMFVRDNNRKVFLWDGAGTGVQAPASPVTAITSQNKSGNLTTVAAQGAAEATRVSGSDPIEIGTIQIGRSSGGLGGYLNGYINHLSVFPTQLNAEQRAALVKLEDF